MTLKRRWDSRGKGTGKPDLVTGPVQVCWHKFVRYWDIEHREIPMEPGRLIMTPEEVLKRCYENTIGVVPTLGVTFTCQYEPVEAVVEALDKLEQEEGYKDNASFQKGKGSLRWAGFFCLQVGQVCHISEVS